MKRTTKYINQFKPPQHNQPDLFDREAHEASQQIKEYHLKKLKALRDEADIRSKEWIRQQRLTMLADTNKGVTK